MNSFESELQTLIIKYEMTHGLGDCDSEGLMHFIMDQIATLRAIAEESKNER